MEENYTIGIDFGTDSVRSLIVNVNSGEEVASSVFFYPRWKKGMYCNPAINQFRQHPQDYLEGLEYTIKEAINKAPSQVVQRIVGISADTTGSTPVAVDEKGMPLSLTDGFRDNPNAMFILWKDHTAIKEAAEINELARKWNTNYIRYEGGIYSSEWFWAKILHIIRADAGVFRAAFSWVEHCDWIPGLLTGNTSPPTLKRSRCAAGHKAMWHESFNGLPSEEFLKTLDPMLAGLRSRLYKESYECNSAAGKLASDWAARLGLPVGIPVGVGVLDAHMGAIGAGIKPNYLVKVMGTSTCDLLVASGENVGDKPVAGICGQVNGSILPGMMGLEAGQSAFGDVYAWFNRLLEWPLKNIIQETQLLDEKSLQNLIEVTSGKILTRLGEDASKVPVGESGIVALDWLNGRRTPDSNQNLSGAIAGLTLGSDAPRIFRALVEATAFGSKVIIERFKEENIRIDGIIALGGVAKKSPFVMQVLADVLNMPVSTARSEQACALGAAMAAAVVSGIYETITEAQESMGQGTDTTYQPIPGNVKKYEILYSKYKNLGNFMELQFQS